MSWVGVAAVWEPLWPSGPWPASWLLLPLTAEGPCSLVEWPAEVALVASLSCQLQVVVAFDRRYPYRYLQFASFWLKRKKLHYFCGLVVFPGWLLRLRLLSASLRARLVAELLGRGQARGRLLLG